MNLKIREMTVTLRNYIDGVDLPPEVKRIALKEIYNDISAEAEQAVASEIEERDAKEKNSTEVEKNE